MGRRVLEEVADRERRVAVEAMGERVADGDEVAAEPVEVGDLGHPVVEAHDAVLCEPEEREPDERLGHRRRPGRGVGL